MDDTEIRATLSRAERIVEQVPEPLRVLAFGAVLEHLLKTQRPSHREEAPARPPARGIPANLSEFLVEKKPATHIERVVATAYYSFHSGDAAGVTADEVIDGYGKARVSKPRNIHDVIAKSVKKGLLIESDQKKDGTKAWVITPTGEAYVESGFGATSRRPE